MAMISPIEARLEKVEAWIRTIRQQQGKAKKHKGKKTRPQIKSPV